MVESGRSGTLSQTGEAIQSMQKRYVEQAVPLDFSFLKLTNVAVLKSTNCRKDAVHGEGQRKPIVLDNDEEEVKKVRVYMTMTDKYACLE